MNSTTITNVRIADGLGGEPQFGSLTFSGDTITNVTYGDSPAPSDDSTVVLDGGGYVLAPGFIDLHSHADYTVQGAPAAETQLAQGVTTLLFGNCGFSPFPARSIEEVREKAAFLGPQFKGEWHDAAGYSAAVAQCNPGVNVALQLGLGSLRQFVVGDAERPLTSDEIGRMQGEIEQAIAQGIRGFSSGLIYAPGSFTTTEEIAELLGPVAAAGLIYSTHIRNESGELLNAVKEALDAARGSDARLEISHVKAIGPENHGKMHDLLALIDEAREAGIDVAGDVYPYTASSTVLTSRLPSYAMDGGVPALMTKLGDPDTRSRIAADVAVRFGRDIDPDGVVIADLGVARDGGEGYRRYIGQSLTEIGAQESCSPEEAAMRLLEEHLASVLIINHAMSEEDIAAALRHPYISVASDGQVLATTGQGNPHPRSFGTFARVLGRYVRERQILSLGEAVRKMTSLPASRLKLEDRGQIGEGMRADLVLFDPETIADRSTYDDPWQLATGVHDVWVNGVHALRDGKVATARGGRVI